jgi:hypothetical protein
VAQQFYLLGELKRMSYTQELRVMLVVKHLVSEGKSQEEIPPLKYNSNPIGDHHLWGC